MKLFLGSMFVLALLGTAAIRAGEEDDLKKLEGTWNLIATEQDGMKGDPNNLKSAKLVIKGNKLTVYAGKFKSSESIIKINPKKTPKTIDYTQTFGGPKGTRYLGIYALEGDVLKICVAEKGRPNAFSAKKGTGRSFDTWQRAEK